MFDVILFPARVWFSFHKETSPLYIPCFGNLFVELRTGVAGILDSRECYTNVLTTAMFPYKRKTRRVQEKE
jgi:hypothetical protein